MPQPTTQARHFATAVDLDTLAVLLEEAEATSDEVLDLDDLPRFCRAEPYSDAERAALAARGVLVASWDDDRVLLREARGPWTITPRALAPDAVGLA